MIRQLVTPMLVASSLAGTTTLSLQAQRTDLGSIDFPTSGSAGAQEHFIEGVLLLHSFEYADAAQAFRIAQQADPDFAMAYWGEAMTYNHPVWFEQDRDAARRVLERLAPTREARRAKAPTAREKAYLEAVEILFGEGPKASRDTAYSDAMRRLAEAYPDDHDARAFYALSLLGTSHGGRDIPTYMQAAAQVEEVFRDNPRHPGAAHYLIHSYDDPIHAPLGLRAARAYSKIAPAASHAQHMTSHIFVATGMWDDVVSANETSWEVADRRVQRRGLGVDQRNFHALFWLEYGYLQQGRYGDAMETLGVMRSDEAKSGSRRTRGYLADMRAAYIVGTREWDSDAVRATVDTKDLSAQVQAEDLFATGWSALERGERRVAESTLQEMRRRREATLNSGRDVYMPAVRAAEVMEKQLQALLARDAGDGDGAVAILNGATVIEDAMPFEFGPPVVVKPSHELLGEVLLELGHPEEARREFERALARTPKKVLALLGLARAAAAARDTQQAAEAYADLREIWHRADPGLPEVEEAGRFVAGREEGASRE